MKVIPPHISASHEMFKPYANYFKEQIARIFATNPAKGTKLLLDLKQTQPEIYDYITHKPLEIDKDLQEKLRSKLAQIEYNQQ